MKEKLGCQRYFKTEKRIRPAITRAGNSNGAGIISLSPESNRRTLTLRVGRIRAILNERKHHHFELAGSRTESEGWTLRQNKHCFALADCPSHRRAVHDGVGHEQGRRHTGAPDRAPIDGGVDLDRSGGSPHLATWICVFTALSGEHVEAPAASCKAKRIWTLWIIIDRAAHGRWQHIISGPIVHIIRLASACGPGA